MDSAVLEMSHHYPPTSTKSRPVNVIIDQVLETTFKTDLEDGAWVNVIGYLIDDPAIVDDHPAPNEKRRRRSKRSRACVQAIMLWGAGSIDLQAYEQSVVLRQGVSTTIA